MSVGVLAFGWCCCAAMASSFSLLAPYTSSTSATVMPVVVMQVALVYHPCCPWLLLDLW